MFNRALAILLLVAFVGAGIQSMRLSALKQEVAAERLQRAQDAAKAEAAARDKEQALAANARKAEQAYAQNSARLRADASGARDELERLRDILAPDQAASASAAGAGTHDPAAARLVVGECAQELQALAATADGLAAKLTGLQDYVRAVNPPPKTE